MWAGADFRQMVGWLMLTLALLVGINPIALADRDSSHFGGGVDPSSFHAHDGAGAGDHHAIDSADPADHHDAYCTDHCCSDTCAAPLHPGLPAVAALQNPVIPSLFVEAWPSPAEERLIPPRSA